MLPSLLLVDLYFSVLFYCLCAVWTPQGVMSRALEANEVRRTRSGRCVIPRLAVWAGQYAQRDADGNVTIGFTSLAAEQHFAKLAEQELHVPVSRVFVGLECPRSHSPWDSCLGMNP